MRYISLSGLLCLVLSACGQAPKDIKVAQADSLQIQLYATRSAAFEKKQPDSSIYLAGQGLKLARQLHYRFGEALMLSRFARINEHYGNMVPAEKYQRSALAIFTALHSREAINATADLGVLEAHLGKVTQGTNLINQSLNRYRQLKDTIGIIKAYTRLGELHELIGDRRQALVEYTKAEQLNRGNLITDDYFSLITTLGKLHTELGNHQQAAAYYEKGIARSSHPKHIKAHIALLNHAGKSWSKIGDPQKAAAYHQQGLDKAQANGLTEETANSLLGMAHAVKGMDADQSVAHLKHALEISRSIGYHELSAQIFYSLSDIYRQQSRYAEALEALQEHHRLIDSLEDANEHHKIAVLQSSYELAESKIHVEALEINNREKTYQRNLLLLAAISILLILVVITFYFYRNRKLNKQLTTSNVIKDKLFSIIGHDLRNPIGGITQMLAVMEEGELTTGEFQQMISEMRKQGNVTLEILNALLNWGEAQLKGIHIKPANLNAKESILKTTTALHQQAENKTIQIHTNIADDLVIYADANHFDFVIRNLLSNAIKFSPLTGNIWINATTEPGQVIFSVADQGKGISPEQQEQFAEADLDVTFGTNGEKGTGIGLMLSKEFVKANHGRIWLESEIGKGTTFYFNLPTHG